MSGTEAKLMHLSENEPKMKHPSTSPEVSESPSNGELPFENIGDALQNEYLAQIGKKPELKRTFGLGSMLALSVSLMATWEALSSVLGIGMVEGGPVALVYGYIVAFLGTMVTVLSLAEIASMYPTSGGQYHWVAELAPKPYKASFSFIAGWITVAGWEATTASAAFAGGTQIQSLIFLNHEDYEAKRWQGTLLYWAVLWVALGVNIYLMKVLPHIENATAILHVGLFLAFIIAIPILVTPKSSAKFVFTTFINNSGWKSDGVSWCIGMLTSCYVLIGYDGAAHMSEELHNAAVDVPKAMIAAVALNSAMGFGWLLMLLFCIGDFESVVNSQTGYPYMQIYYNATQSLPGATAMISLTLLMALLSTIPLLAATSRTLWAFARDGGLPCSKYLAHVDDKQHIPIRALLLSTVLLMLLGLINIGSTTAFNALVSMSVVALYVSYLFPIVLMVWIRIRQSQQLNFGPFRLGRCGLTLNILAILFTIWVTIFLLFPSFQPVTPQDMNYSSLVLGAVLLFSIFWWFVHGKRNFLGPTVMVITGQ